MAVIDLVLGFLKVVTIVYDIVTFPIYGITQQSWKDRTKQNLGHVSKNVKDSLMERAAYKSIFTLQVNNVTKSNKAVTYKRDKGSSQIYQEIIVQGKVDTVTKAFNYAVGKFGDRECIGTREVLGEEDETQSNGKVIQYRNGIDKI